MFWQRCRPVLDSLIVNVLKFGSCTLVLLYSQSKATIKVYFRAITCELHNVKLTYVTISVLITGQ